MLPVFREPYHIGENQDSNQNVFTICQIVTQFFLLDFKFFVRPT